MPLTTEERRKLADADFAFPDRRLLPIRNTPDDETHVKMALSAVATVKGPALSERAAARHRIIRRARELGIDISRSTVEASVAFEVAAMALGMPPADGHPNRLPFDGVLTFVDRASDNPVGGAKGHKTFIPKDVAEEALPSLLGMAIDFKPELDGHDRKSKIGVITEATLEGDEIRIAGHFYAADFPEEVARIQAEKEDLGFSYEAQTRIQDLKADPWVIEFCRFTGAAVLYKADAAYTETRLAAQAEPTDLEIDMTPEELKAALSAGITEALKPVTAAVDTLKTEVAAIKGDTTKLQASKAVMESVEPHASALCATADAMEKANMGLHNGAGHVKLLRHMASQMRAEAAQGKTPHVYNDHSFFASADNRGTQEPTQTEKDLKAANDKLQTSVDTLGTQLKDLQAKAFNNAAPPARKTLSPEITLLLKKGGLELTAESQTITVEQVDKALEAAGIKGTAATAAKLRMQAAGVIAPTH